MRGPLTADGKRLAPLAVSTGADGTLLACMNGTEGVWAMVAGAAASVGVEGPGAHTGSAVDPSAVPLLPQAYRSGELTRSERAKFFAKSWRVRDEAIEAIARLRPT